MNSISSAEWHGGLKDGNGSISTNSGALSQTPYSFQTRFEGKQGTNPEELIGAAHAGCFTMAFAAAVEKAGFKADTIQTTATVTLSKVGEGFEISTVNLSMKAKIPNIDQDNFNKIANDAKQNCPVSKLFKATITLDATLEA